MQDLSPEQSTVGRDTEGSHTTHLSFQREKKDGGTQGSSVSKRSQYDDLIKSIKLSVMVYLFHELTHQDFCFFLSVVQMQNT